MIGFGCKEDAERVLGVLPQRLGRYGLRLSDEKTRLIHFERPRDDEDGRGNGTFDFLGFTWYWGRRGGWDVHVKTRTSRMTRTLAAIAEYCRKSRHRPVREQHLGLKSRLQGHFNYFAVSGNDSTGLAAAVLGYPDLEEGALTKEPAIEDDVEALPTNGASVTIASTEVEATLAVDSDVRRPSGRAGWWKSPCPDLEGATGRVASPGYPTPGLVHRGPRDRRLPAQADERGARLRGDVRRVEPGGGALRGFARAPHLEPASGGRRDRQRPSMEGEVTGSAVEPEIARIVAATVGAVDKVMQLEPHRGSTTGSLAAAAVAAPHEADHARRDVLSRALRHVAVDRADVLGIAARAVERGRVDRDRRAGGLLRRSIAARAHRHGDLELRAAGRFGARVGRAVEHRVAQRRDQLIVVEERTVLAGERGADLAQAREDLGAELEPHHVRARLRIGRSVGRVTAAMARHQVLDLAHVLAGRGVAPPGFSLRRRDPGELADGREREFAARERVGQHRQLTERARDPQPLLRDVRGVAEHSLEVVERRHHPERSPDLQPLRLVQPPRFQGVERCAPPGNPAQRPIDRTPVEARVAVPRGTDLVDDSRSFLQHDALLATRIEMSQLASSTRIPDALYGALRDDSRSAPRKRTRRNSRAHRARRRAVEDDRGVFVIDALPSSAAAVKQIRLRGPAIYLSVCLSETRDLLA